MFGKQNTNKSSTTTDLDASDASASEHTMLLSSQRTIGSSTLQEARHLLYVSHAFNQFSERTWQFALILFLAAFSNYQSLFLISSYGLASTLSIVLFGSSIGRFVDDANRLHVARYFIWTENMSVLAATTLCYWLLLNRQGTEASTYDFLSVFLLVGIHFFGSLAGVLDRGFLVAIERDWIVVMSKASPEDDRNWLSETNVAMKQIDLTCKVAAPAVAGFIIAAFDTSEEGGNDLTGAAILVGGVNVASLIVEYICTARIYHLVPTLSLQGQEGRDDDEIEEHLEAQMKCNEVANCGIIPQGLKTYLSQPISLAGFGLALLYLNALTFGGLMTGYLVWRGMRLETVGVWRGISAAVGLSGTFVYHFSVQRTTLVSTGMWSVVYQFACISLSFASLFVSDYNLSIVMLIVGVCASRIGLWVFDIAVTQLMQEFIPAGIRGAVGGTQQSLNAFFQLLSFALGLVFPDPREFHIYVSAGYAAVAFAMLIYTFGIYGMHDDFVMETDRRPLSS